MISTNTTDWAARFSGAVDIRSSFAPRPGISHVLFDFDGTLSLIREGWPEVMVPMFVEMLPRRSRTNSPPRIPKIAPEAPTLTWFGFQRIAPAEPAIPDAR